MDHYQAVMSLLPTTDNTVTDDDDANDLMKIKIVTQERSYELCIVDSQRQTLGGSSVNFTHNY